MLVALVTKGWLAAVIVLIVVVAVMQLESHVLQPFLLGRSVRLHPVAVVLAILLSGCGAPLANATIAVNDTRAVLDVAHTTIEERCIPAYQAAKTPDDIAPAPWQTPQFVSNNCRPRST